MQTKGFSHRTLPVGEHPGGCRRFAIDAIGDLREIAGVKKHKLFKIRLLCLSNYPKILFCTLSLLVSLSEQGKVCARARMPTG